MIGLMERLVLPSFLVASLVQGGQKVRQRPAQTEDNQINNHLSSFTRAGETGKGEAVITDHQQRDDINATTLERASACALLMPGF